MLVSAMMNNWDFQNFLEQCEIPKESHDMLIKACFPDLEDHEEDFQSRDVLLIMETLVKTLMSVK